MLLDLQKYDIKVTYKPGSTMTLADTLSRACLNETREDLGTSDINVNILSYLPISQDQYVKFQQETAADPDLQLLQDTVLQWVA